MSNKLHILLAKTEHGSKVYKNNIADYTQFMKTKQGAFKGEVKTYSPNPDTLDEPSMRGNTPIITTVNEKLDWFEEHQGNYINDLLSVEATNASGKATALLEMGGLTYKLSSLELLRLKSLLEGEIKGMYEQIPTLEEKEIWTESKNDAYINRPVVYETKMTEGIKKGTQKETYIVKDPNVAELKDSSRYTPVTAVKESIQEYGSWTHQRFSGEWTARQRAELLDRRSKLLGKVLVALKECNEAEAISSVLSAKSLFDYLHRG